MWLHASVLLNWVLLSEWSGRRGGVYDLGGLGCSQRLPLSVWVVPATLRVPVTGWPQKRELGPLSSGQGKVDAICRSRSNRAKRQRAGCILRSPQKTECRLIRPNKFKKIKLHFSFIWIQCHIILYFWKKPRIPFYRWHEDWRAYTKYLLQRLHWHTTH